MAALVLVQPFCITSDGVYNLCLKFLWIYCFFFIKYKSDSFSLSYERDPSKLETNAIYLYVSGSLYDGTWKSVFSAVFRMFFLLMGCIQYMLKIVIRDEETSQLTLVEALHWMIVFLSVITMVISCLVKTSIFLKMQAMIKSGIYDYEGNISEEQILARATANRGVQFSTSLFTVCCIFGIIISYFKAPLMQMFALPYPLWFPYKINSYWRYLPSMIWVWFVAETMTTAACSNWVAYVTMAGHLIGQFKILILAIKEIDALAKGEDAEVKVLKRIKCCVQHHLLLINFFFDLQSYFNISLLVTAFGTALVLCTLGYVLVSPETTMATAGALLFVFIPELCIAGYYCFLGQKIADVTEEIGLTIYSLKWYTMPLSVQRDLLMMLVGSKKTRQLSGFGLHEFSIKGLSEILQASFTYFNMLMALSGGK